VKRLYSWHMQHQGIIRLVRTSLGGAFLLASLILTWTGNNNFLPFDLAWLAIVLCGVPIVLGALLGLIRDHDVTADVLVSLALIGCLIIKEYSAAGEVAFIMELGTILEDFTSSKAQQGIKSLIKMSPKEARRVKDGKEEMVRVEDIRLKDILSVLPGEEIPIDGKVREGLSDVDESSLTGESLPLEKKEGDKVFSGTMNLSSLLLIEATSTAENSSFQRIVAMAKEQDAKKAHIIKKADKWAAYMVLVSFLTALLTCLIYYWVSKDFWLGFLRGVTVLVVFCPCAFVLATPTRGMSQRSDRMLWPRSTRIRHYRLRGLPLPSRSWPVRMMWVRNLPKKPARSTMGKRRSAVFVARPRRKKPNPCWKRVLPW
jgi:cation transport ATPase